MGVQSWEGKWSGLVAIGLATVLGALIMFGPPAVPAAQGSSGSGSEASVSRAKIPRLTLSASLVREGGKPRALSAFFGVKERFRYNSIAHLNAIERYYRPRNVRVRLFARTYRLKNMNTLLPEMMWAFVFPTKNPALLRCKKGSRPRATLKFRNKKGTFVRKVRVRCR